jgi:hypothetical protein
MALCVHQSPQHNTDAGVFQCHRIAIEFGFGLGGEWIGKAAFRIVGVISNFTATRIFPVNLLSSKDMLEKPDLLWRTK